MGAGTMAMGFFVAPNRKFGNMRAHDVAGEVEVDVPAAGAAFFPSLKLHVLCVGNEVDRHLESPDLPLAAEIIFVFRREAIDEGEVVVENEIEIVKQVHHERRAGDGEKLHRGGSLPIEVLVLSVQRNSEQAPGMPLEGVLAAVFLPYGGSPVPVKNINNLLVKMF